MKTESLSWSVHDKAIIKDIDFTISKGETVAIVGPNGAGKTSLLKCLYGEYCDYIGDIYLKNKSLKQVTRRQLAQQIAVVSQQPVSIFELAIIDIVRMGLIPHKGLFDGDTSTDNERLILALKKVDLETKQDQSFNTLSGGEQQRVLIARAIVQNPDILIMDEPTNHLDIYYQHQILKLAKQLNITLIITIHDLNLAAQYCDRVILLDNGKIVADNTPKSVFTQQTLTQVFKLNCHIDENPFTLKPRITFAGIPAVQQEVVNGKKI